MHVFVAAFTASQTCTEPAKAFEYTAYGNVHDGGNDFKAHTDEEPTCTQPHSEDTNAPNTCVATLRSP